MALLIPAEFSRFDSESRGMCRKNNPINYQKSRNKT